MTPEQQTLVRNSFAKVAPIADTAAALFYDELFERDPALRSLFKPDMTEQRQKLMAKYAPPGWHASTRWQVRCSLPPDGGGGSAQHLQPRTSLMGFG